jgi:DNA-binding transcriptional MerR regulator
MRIGELARRTGASPRSLRYYEDQGLLAATRSPGGHREYAENSVERVERIRCLYSAGLNSDTVRDILPCMYANELGEPAPDLLDTFRAERERIDAAGDPAFYTFSAIGHTSELTDAAGAVLNARLAHHLRDAPAVAVPDGFDEAAVANNVQAIQALPEGAREMVTDAWVNALNNVFLAALPFMAIALVAAIMIPEIPLGTRKTDTDQDGPLPHDHGY